MALQSQLSLDDIVSKERNQRTEFRTADALDNEFRYYSKLIQDLVLLLTKQADRDAVIPWASKLATPAYNVDKLRDKRNRYMLMLCLSLTLNSLEGPFITSPPEGILQDLGTIGKPRFVTHDWEGDTTWEDEVKNMEEVDEEGFIERKRLHTCCVHGRYCPKDTSTNKQIGSILDKQFRFLLYLARPYAAILRRASDRIRAAKWLQLLCSVDKNDCSMQKGIRNDYMMTLLGYLCNQMLLGPFQDFPPDNLEPLATAANVYADKVPITDPTHPRTAEFFRSMPQPEEGAFALITLTGDLQDAKFK